MKASEMILKIASGFIAMDETIEQKQSNLNASCTAWNLSLLPENKREECIKTAIYTTYLIEYFLLAQNIKKCD